MLILLIVSDLAGKKTAPSQYFVHHDFMGHNITG
jgi:hypothetical protein